MTGFLTRCKPLPLVTNTFDKNAVYTASVTLTAESGYIFAPTTSFTATINTFTAVISNNTGATVKLSYTFPKTTLDGIIVGWNFDEPSFPDCMLATEGTAANIGTKTFSVNGATLYTSDTTAGMSGYSVRATNWDDGADSKYWLAPFDAVGFESLVLVSSYQMSSNTGPRDFKLQYSTNGTSWNDVDDGEITVSTGWTSGVLIDLALPAALDNCPTTYLRWIMTSDVAVNGGTVANTGTSRLDEVYIAGLPSTSTPTSINVAAVTGVEAPSYGEEPNTTASCVTEHVTIGDVSWSPEVTDTFDKFVIYTASVTLTAESGYVFAPTASFTATINTHTAVISANTGSTVKLSYTFPKTIPDGVDIIVGWNFNASHPACMLATDGTAANNGIMEVSAQGGQGGFTTSAGKSGTAVSATGWEDGEGVKYWLAPFDTTGYGNLVLVSSYQQSSNTGPRDFKLQYSTDNSDWYDVDDGEITTANNMTSGVLLNLPLPDAMNDQSTAYLRWIMTSNISARAGTGTFAIDDAVVNGGTSRLDEVYIAGAPMP